MTATNACIKISEDKSMKFTLRKSKSHPLTYDFKYYRYQYDENRTQKLFNEICSQIPRYKGTVVIYGHKNQKMILIGCIQSQSNLREKFSRSTVSIENQPMSRFAWMVALLQSKIYNKLTIFYTYQAA